MFSKTLLKNNLTLLASPMPGTKSTTVMVMVRAGSRYETAKINGLSHFLEHMAFKGTKKRPTAKHISQEIDAIGGEFNAFTSKDHTAYFIKAASVHTDLMLDILSDMLTNSLYKPEEIEREKGVIIEEINMYEDTPMRKVGEVFENLMFGETPMGRDIAGTVETVRNLKRADFLKYVNSLYKSRNMVIAVAGGIGNKSEIRPASPSGRNPKFETRLADPCFAKGFDEARALAKRANSKIKNQNKNIRVNPLAIRENPSIQKQNQDENLKRLQDKVESYFSNIKDEKTQDFDKFKQLQKSPRIRVQYKKTEQAHLVLGFPSISINDPRRYALSVLTTILGGGMSSRLFIQVRERRGLAYYVHASNDSYFDCGAWTVSAGVDLKRIDEAVKVIREEIYKTIRDSHGLPADIRGYPSVSQSRITGSIRGSHNLNNTSRIRVDHKGKITDSELRKAKEYLKGHLILGLEDSQAVAGLYASQFLLEDKIETPEEIIENVDKVTLHDVYSVASDIFQPKLINLAVIGPFENEERFKKLIS